MPGEDEALHALVSGNDLCTVNVAVSKVSELSVDKLLFIKSTRQQVESNILYFKIFNRLLPKCNDRYKQPKRPFSLEN